VDKRKKKLQNSPKTGLEILGAPGELKTERPFNNILVVTSKYARALLPERTIYTLYIV
jgi:hypothetical protein